MGGRGMEDCCSLPSSSSPPAKSCLCSLLSGTKGAVQGAGEFYMRHGAVRMVVDKAVVLV